MSDHLPESLQENVPLAPRTTLGVGGPARYFLVCKDLRQLLDALDFAQKRSLKTCVLGGGSNLLVADSGFDGLVLDYAEKAIKIDDLQVSATAGVDWDDLVAHTVAAGLAGIEALSGIPGRVGAAPIQNIGAYGQEVSETIEAVEVLDRSDGSRRTLSADECGFAYRDSSLKSRWKDRYVIVQVLFRLRREDAGCVRYGELARRLQWREGDPPPPLTKVREAVLDLRRSKSMLASPLLDPDDPNRRSAGSFFTNPLVTTEQAHKVRSVYGEAQMPAFPTADGQVKLSAAWLIQRSGFPPGFRHGRAALSSRHCLALINPGNATSADLVALAAHIRHGVREICGVTLHPEPVFLGFEQDTGTLLDLSRSAEI